MTLWSEHMSMNIDLWVGMDIFGIFWWPGQNILKISLCHLRMTWKIFFHIYMDESHKMDEHFGWKLNINEVLDDKYKLMNNLDENFDRLKWMDGTNSKIVMLNENHIYMDENYKKDEIFGWMWNMNELLDDNWK
jgi:hypothetical protein